MKKQLIYFTVLIGIKINRHSEFNWYLLTFQNNNKLYKRIRVLKSLQQLSNVELAASMMVLKIIVKHLFGNERKVSIFFFQ